MAIRALSICSGIGGLDLGLRIAEPCLRTVCYVEREAYAASVLVARMAEQVLDLAPIWDNLKTFPVSAFARKIHLVFGGIPCQPYSAAGKRLGAKDGRDLWPDAVRILSGLGAQAFFLENVRNFISDRDGLTRVLADLASLGFDAEWGVYSCAGLGAPHVRQRVFVLAYTRRFLRLLQQERREHEAQAFTESDRRSWFSDSLLGDLGHDRSELGHSPRIDGVMGPPEGRDDSSGLTQSSQVSLPPEGQRLQGVGRSEEEPEPFGPRGFWPPGRDPELWRGVEPRLWPSAAKLDLRRVADGVPDWLVSANRYRGDRLHALGNAVSPPVAAVAWLDLVSRALATLSNARRLS